jgi:hypothetical protein
MRVQLIKFLVGIVFALFANSALHAQDPEMVRHFDYDRNAPLDLKIAGTQKRGQRYCVRHHLRQSERRNGAGVSGRARR